MVNINDAIAKIKLEPYDIKTLLVPNGIKNNPNSNLASISYITIHCTGNYSATATAESHANYLANGSGGRQASWHYTVDANEIWRSFADNRRCWHAGDGNNGPGNSTSIGIEICVNDENTFVYAAVRCAKLVSELIKKYGLNYTNIAQHKRWSGKTCPAELISGKWGIDWNTFIFAVQSFAEEKEVNLTMIDYPILNPTSIVNPIQAWAESKGANQLFIDLMSMYIDVPLPEHVQLVSIYGAVCQAAVETGWGKFGGVLTADYKNPCGMKTPEGGSDTDKNAHYKFDTWSDGIEAHLEHLALYAGAPGYPLQYPTDPRHFKGLYGTANTFNDLSKTWASDTSYGEKINKLIKEAILFSIK